MKHAHHGNNEFDPNYKFASATACLAPPNVCEHDSTPDCLLEEMFLNKSLGSVNVLGTLPTTAISCNIVQQCLCVRGTTQDRQVGNIARDCQYLSKIANLNPSLGFLICDWVTAKIGLNGLDLDLDQNKHRINLEWDTAKVGLNGLDPDLDQNKHRINLE